MRFMMLMIPAAYQKEGDPPMPAPKDVEEMGKFNEKLVKAGVLLAADGLRSASDGARVYYSGDGRPRVVDGPFSEAKEVLGGYWMIQVNSREEAVEWARRCPAADGDVIEIRQVFEPEDFGSDVARQEREMMEGMKRNAHRK